VKRDKTQSAGEFIARNLQEIKDLGGLARVATVGAIDVEARTVEVSFSSETDSVERWFGIEVLSHDAGAVDLSRLNNAAPVLWMHNTTDQRGVVVSARVDADRKGRAVLRFSQNPAGEQLFRDIQDQIVTKISVGYQPTGMRLVEERADGTDVFLVTSWQPYEISLVSVPADDSVGVGRSYTNKQGVASDSTKAVSAPISQGEVNNESRETRSNPQPTQPTKGKQKMEKFLRDASGNLVRAIVDEAGAITQVLEVIERAGDDARNAQSRGADTERSRVRDLTEMGKQYGKSDLAAEFVLTGKSAEDFRRELLGAFAAERTAKPMADQVKGSEIGLTDKETRQFSILKATRALANPHDKKFQKDAAFEFECSRAAEDMYGKQSKGILIPSDVLNRAFATTTGGGAAVATNLLANQFIELLRHKTWAMKRVTTMGGLVGNVDIPRQNAAGQAYWVGEGGAPTASAPGLDQIAFTPKSLAAYTDVTRRLMLQSTPDAEAMVRNDLLRVLGLELDRAVLYGTGADGQPKGLLNQNGLAHVDLAGMFASFAEYVAMETEIAAADADVEVMSYVINAKARGNAKTTQKFPGTPTGATIWEQGNTINGYNVDVTNQLVDGDAFLGAWSSYVVAMWGGLDLTVDPYSLSTSGSTRLVVFQEVDMNVRHLESFVHGSKPAA
jgi:HK97 family phage major capsid protein/HK97 family phage prohead protease